MNFTVLNFNSLRRRHLLLIVLLVLIIHLLLMLLFKRHEIKDFDFKPQQKENRIEVKIEPEIIVEPVKNVFDFIKNPEKLKSLIRTNELLKINTSKHNRLVFVYSCPKVGSTSIVSSLRIFGSDKVDIIHIHCIR